mmetsp:Transcript_58458/g.165112  ORF Transcript_58458/g.165112 Transcript_58458/m.165112 type:complete len:463 (-) Transcript_58458:1418-2806(-)
MIAASPTTLTSAGRLLQAAPLLAHAVLVAVLLVVVQLVQRPLPPPLNGGGAVVQVLLEVGLESVLRLDPPEEFRICRGERRCRVAEQVLHLLGTSAAGQTARIRLRHLGVPAEPVVQVRPEEAVEGPAHAYQLRPRLRLLDERAPVVVLAEDLRVADHPEVLAGARERHVHPAAVPDEADGLLVGVGVGAHDTDDDAVLLAPLEAINSAHVHGAALLLREQRAEAAPDELDLLRVGRDDRELLAPGLLRVQLAQHLEEVDDEVGLRVVDERRLVLSVLALDVEEHHWPEARYLGPHVGEFALELWSVERIDQVPFVERLGREAADVGVHAVLRLQHVHLVLRLLQALEEAPLVVVRLRHLREARGRKLLGVPDEDQALAPQLQGHQGAYLNALRRFVDDDRVEVLGEARDVLVAGDAQGRAHDPGLHEEARLDLLLLAPVVQVPSSGLQAALHHGLEAVLVQ